MTMDFDDLTLSNFETKYVTITKLKILNDKNVKQVLSHLIFLTQFVCGVILHQILTLYMVQWIDLILKIVTIIDRETNRQT